LDVLNDVADALNQGRITDAKNLIIQHSFHCDGIDETQARTLLKNVIENEYADALKSRIGTTLYNNLANSKELIALMSIYYQNPSAIQKPLIDALAANNNAGNRAEAWYEIRYNMNYSDADWLANRRYKEANEFSLYNNPDSITPDEAKEVMRMYTIHEIQEQYTGLKLSTREYLFPPPSGINSIATEINPAKSYLITNFALGNTINGEVIVGAGLTSYAYKEGSNINDTGNKSLNGTNKNDLIFGEAGKDSINGGAGNDVIYGGEGNDTLIGGANNDTLLGGANDDTYEINYGDGNDTIIDTEGKNTIIYRGQNGQQRKLENFYSTGSGTNAWVTADGELHLEHHSPWTITFEDGSTITLGEDTDPGDFGINLLDMPQDPTTTLTITGDLMPTSDPPQYDALGNVIVDPNSPSPGRNDILYGSTGNDRIEGKGGSDMIYAWQGGNDWIQGGSGRDGLSTGDGSDVIEGGTDADLIFGGAGDDQLFGETKGEMDDLIAAGV